MPFLADLLGQVSPFAKLTMVVAVAAFRLAVAYVLRPTEQKLLLMRPISLASIFATASGLFGGWIAVLWGMAATPDGQLSMMRLYRGIAESLTVGFVSFACSPPLGARGCRRAATQWGVLRKKDGSSGRSIDEWVGASGKLSLVEEFPDQEPVILIGLAALD
jgi:hypothetical protein